MHDGPSMHGGLVEHFPFRNEHQFILEMSPFVLSLRRAMSSSLKRAAITVLELYCYCRGRPAVHLVAILLLVVVVPVMPLCGLLFS